jgi:hypothetical protein
MILKRILPWAIVPLILINLISCNSLTVAIPILNNTITISQIEQKQPDEQISLTGKVVNTAPFLQGGAYQLEDNTGKIWVITEVNLPKKGDKIKLKGQIKQENIAVDTLNLNEFYLLELSLNSTLDNNSILQMFFPHK